jgi:hypothetical protein
MTNTARIGRFILFLTVLLGMGCSVWADDQKEEILLPNRFSPDGTKEIIFVRFIGDPEYSGDHGSLSVRNTKDEKIITQRDFFSRGWGPDNMTILWRPDSKCFTIGSSISKGFMGFQAFAPHKGEWAPVEIPQISKEVVKVAKEAGEKRVIVDEDFGGKGCETPSAWLSNNSLRLEVAYRGIWEAGEEAYQGFWVTLQIIDSDGKAKPRAIIKSIELQPSWRSQPH